MILLYIDLFFSFFKIGLAGFGGGYAMLSMIFAESAHFGITFEQFADLNALDMVVPGPIAINAATYVGYLRAGFLGSLFATIGVALPSLIIITLVMIFFKRYRENQIMDSFLYGVKPAAVGLIAAAAMMIASGVLLLPGTTLATVFSNFFGTISLALVGIFIAVAFCNIKLKWNPILLTVAAGIVGAVFLG